MFHAQRSKSVAKIAPLVSRIFSEWWISQRPQQVSFKNHSCSETCTHLLTVKYRFFPYNYVFHIDISGVHYDETANESYFDQCFTIEAKIGEGSFGEVSTNFFFQHNKIRLITNFPQVFRVRSKEDGRLYAVKRTMGCFRSATHRLEKLSEVQKHERLPKHPNLVRFYKAWEEQGALYIQTELCKTR